MTLKRLSVSDKTLLKCAVSVCIVFLVYCIYFYKLNKFLPYPFFYDKTDTLMDFFNINFSSLSGLAYSRDHVFYSPFLLLLGIAITPTSCFDLQTAYDLRDCAGYTYWIFFFVTNAVAFYFLKKIIGSCDGANYWLLLFAISFPLLYGLERGNYIHISLLLLTLFLLYSDGIRGYLTLPFVLLSKYYLCVIMLPYLLSRNYRLLMVAAAAFVSWNLIFAYIYADPGWLSIYKYLISFSSGTSNLIEAIYMPTSLQPYVALLSKKGYAADIFLPALLLVKISVVARLIQFVRSAGVHTQNQTFHMMMVLIVFLQVFTPAASYYSIVLLIPFFCYFIGKNLFDLHEKLLVMMLMLPLPFAAYVAYSHSGVAYISNEFVKYQVVTGWHSIITPILLLGFFYKITIWSYDNEE